MSRTRKRWFETAAVAVLACAVGPLSAAHAAPALPTGGKVVAGSASIGAPSGGTLSITQSTSKAIIDWNGFSIGSGGKVSFANGSGATLNRVTGAQVSSLDGLLSATGSVYLINPNGVIVGRSGVVNVGGTFVASTLDTSNSGFLSGGALSFAGPSTAAVVNYGKVGSLGGDVALIATRVSNAGTITAANGDAGLLAGSRVLLKDASLDEGRFSVLLGGAGTSVTNSGLIAAADAELRAEGGNVYALAGDTAGVIRATGVSSGGGKVWLVAQGGTLDVAGTIAAQGRGGAAGSVETSGAQVKIGATDIDAHGGSWTVDPQDLVIDTSAATTIDNALNAGTSVTEQTTATGSSGYGTVYPSVPGSTVAPLGDIFVAAPISWSTTAGLTLSAYHSLYLGSVITASGGGALTLITDNTGAGAGGALNFEGGMVQFTGRSGGQPTGSLNIGTGTGAPTPYVLVADLATLSADIAADAAANDRQSNYALAATIDGSNGGAGYATTPLVSTVTTEPFDGVLEGLGNTIQNLAINDARSSDTGLFGVINADGVVRDLTLSGVSITGGAPGVGAGTANVQVGAVAGQNYGTLTNVTVTDGSVTGTGAAQVGGLVGANNGKVSSSYFGASVTDAASGSMVGGIAGFSSGTLADNDSEGSVTVGDNGYAGGLAGQIYAGVEQSGNTVGGTVTGGVNSHVGGQVGDLEAAELDNATSSAFVSTDDGSYAGGLVGYNNGALAGDSAISAVTGGADASVGGLVGYNNGVVSTSYATGSASGGGGAAVGGLVGLNASTVTQSYSSASATGGGADFNGTASAVGGLVGLNAPAPGGGSTQPAGSITDAYAIGAVAGGGDMTDAVGGLVGSNAGTVGDAWASGSVSGGAPATSGGFAGTSSGVITAGYYDQGTTGQSAGVGGQADSAAGVGAVGGNTGLSPYAASSYRELQFGTTPGGASGQAFVIVDADGSLNNAGGAGGGTRPLLLSEYSTNIANVHQLQLMALDLMANYTLTGDVDATATLNAGGADIWAAAGFVPVGGNAAAPFIGSLDGGGYAITSLTIRDSTNVDTGLFGVIGPAGSVSDLTLENPSIVNAYPNALNVATNVGGFAGVNQGVLSDVTNDAGGASASIEDGRLGVAGSSDTLVGFAGGLAGTNAGQITGGDADANVTGSTAGGIAGLNSGTITYSTVDISDITGEVTAGGLAGEDTGPSIANSSSAGAPTVGGGNGVAGGLVGLVVAPSNAVTLSYVSASSASNGAQIGGGLVGQAVSTGGAIDIDNAYATGEVSGGTYAGGLVGYASASGGGSVSINGSYASGAVVGGFGSGVALGGLVGELNGAAASINGAYALGSVTASYSPRSGAVGGLVGDNAGGAIVDAYATGAVTTSGAVTVGGVVGANSGSVNHAYWDVQATGQALDPAVSLTGDPAAGSIGLTTAQFMDPTSPISGLGLATAPSATGGQFVVVDADGTFNGAGGVPGATRPFLLAEAPGFQPASPASVFSAGGEYTVANVHQLQLIGLAPGLTYLLLTPTGDDLNAAVTAGANPSDMWSTAGFIPIGTPAAPFTGVFDGAEGVDDLMVARAASYAGLFGVVGASGVVSASLTDPAISGTGYVGGLVGDNFGQVTGVVYGGTAGGITGASGTGGLVGVNEAGATLYGAVTHDRNANVGPTVTGAGSDVGGLAGANFGRIELHDSHVIVSATGDHVGGVVGYNAGRIMAATTDASAVGLGIISDGGIEGSVSGRDYVGGAVGLNYGQLQSGIDSAGQTVTGRSYVGGVVGWNTADGVIAGAQSTQGTVSASGDYAGGLAGVNQGAITPATVNPQVFDGIAIPTSIAADTVSGVAYVGGLVGLNEGAVSASAAGGTVTGNLYLGGLVGWNNTGAAITTSFSNAVVTGNPGGQDAAGNDYVGGLVGVNFGSISNSYATGSVSGVQVVGGLVGTNMPGGASVSDSYATGAVTASQYAAGSTFGVQAGEVTAVYGFPSLSGQSVESGYYNTPSATGDATDLTAAQEDDPAAYQGFDFTNIWQSNPNNPPILRAAPASAPGA